MILLSVVERPEGPQVERIAENLRRLEIDAVIYIGGNDSAAMLQRLAAHSEAQTVHAIKTIDNDLPLPPGVPTFGFESARATASGVLSTLLEDARTSGRWFFITMTGSESMRTTAKAILEGSTRRSTWPMNRTGSSSP